MTKGEQQALYYKEIVNRLVELYGSKTESAHPFIYEFLEGSIQLFKLILNQDDSGEAGEVVLSFHIELEAVDVIQWFLRVRALDPLVKLTHCYIHDQDGNVYVGEDAHILRAYTIEQEILSAYLASEKDGEEIVSAKVQSEKPRPVKAYSDYKTALNAFKNLGKKKNDTEH